MIPDHIKNLLQHLYEPSEAQAIARLLEEKNAMNTSNVDWQTIEEELKSYKPIQYILGETYFYDDIIFLNQHTLIPRPETEELVHWMIQDNNAHSHIWDIGTGSGCIALTLARKLPQATITATDINPLALDNLHKNAQYYKVDVKSLLHDVFSDELSEFQGIQIIVSNPPYIADFEKQDMAEHVLLHEPHEALFAEGDDPIIFYKRIAEICRSLTQIQKVYLELNPIFAEDIKALFPQELWHVIIKKDMQGHLRMMKCTRITH